MGTYIIKRQEDGKYVRMPGGKHSYTTRLETARRYPTREAAKGDCCGNERVIAINALLRG